MRQIVGKLESARLADPGPALGLDAGVMMKTLTGHGLTVTSTDERIAGIAIRSGRKPVEALMDTVRPMAP